VLLADVPLQALEAGLVASLTLNLAASVLVAVVISGGVYLLVHRLIVRRLEAIQVPLASFAGGDFGTRLPADPAAQDEIARLTTAFNSMAERLEASRLQELESRRLREQAASRERERIARELHDGLAQILGYVGTKATAVRLLLSRRQTAPALEQLQQLEEAAGEVLVDVRQAILGLRLTSRPDLDLTTRLRTFADQFSRMSGLPVRVELPDEPADFGLTAEAEVELLRIVQEAFSNIRKHATADSAWLRLRGAGTDVELTVGDDGAGFDPARQEPGPGGFGLESMHQRAREIGAELEVETEPGAGTRVTVRLSGGKGSP
jgi:signal transduction histidine kinase